MPCLLSFAFSRQELSWEYDATLWSLAHPGFPRILALGSSLNRSRATPCLGRAGFLRGRDGVLLMNHLEDLLVDLFRSQHVRHALNQVWDVRPAGLLVG